MAPAVLVWMNLVAWWNWFHQLGSAMLRVKMALAANAAICLALIAAVLRHDAYYFLLYEMIAGLWLNGALRVFAFFGVSVRDDVLERGNVSALWAVSGALPGIAACFAGSNIGNGPGPEALLFCAVVASAAWLAIWLAADRAGGHWVDAITIERNVGSGQRFGGLLLVVGLVLGWAMTGDWVSAEKTMADFFTRGWPVVLVMLAAAMAERRLR